MGTRRPRPKAVRDHGHDGDPAAYIASAEISAEIATEVATENLAIAHPDGSSGGRIGEGRLEAKKNLPLLFGDACRVSLGTESS